MQKYKASFWTLHMTPANETLKTNVNRLRDRFPALKPLQKLADKAGVGKGTVERMTKDGNCELRSLEGVAKAFGLSPWQLLVPDFNPDDPPVLGKMTPELEASLQRARVLAKELLKIGEEA